MKKYLIAILLGISIGGGAFALSLEAVPSWFGPMSLSPFLDSWKASLEADSSTVTVASVVEDVAAITPAFDTNAVVVATSHTPAGLGQLLVGATNLYVAVGATTNDWLRIK